MLSARPARPRPLRPRPLWSRPLWSRTARRAGAVVALAALALVPACSTAPASDPVAPRAATGSAPSSPAAETPVGATPSATPSEPLPELPRGGRSIFPEHLVVAHYGTAGTDALGVLGGGTPLEAVRRVGRTATPYAQLAGKPVLPTMELVATVAQTEPGPDGDYSVPLRPEEVQPYLDAARAEDALLLLGLQPGRADMLEQAELFEDFLREPDVGLALDPEWKLGPTQLPGDQVGTVDVAEVNRVSQWLAELRAEEQLPEKLFVVHQFRPEMLTRRDRLAARDGLATVVSIDAFGTREVKTEVYGELSAKAEEFVNGFALFYGDDTGLMTPQQVLALQPRPELITYQ